MPKVALADALTGRIESLTTSLFVPMFFVYSKLDTTIRPLNSTDRWILAALVVLVSTLGKGVACMFAARLSGGSWKHSAIRCTLVNARGLMDLIMLNLELECGVMTPTFSRSWCSWPSSRPA